MSSRIEKERQVQARKIEGENYRATDRGNAPDFMFEYDIYEYFTDRKNQK